MKNILLLSGGERFAHSDGHLNQTLYETALTHLDRRGFDLRQTFIDGGYDIPAKVDKFLWADVVIYQMPGWWMGAPWAVKRYIDEIFATGHGNLYANDGRTRSDSTQKYSSDGLVRGEHYMISATWNAPRQVFDDPNDFFEGRGVDVAYFPFHKADQFLGMSGLPTFLVVDMMKRLDVPAAVAAYQAHLDRVFERVG